MPIFCWNDWNVEHIAVHGVLQEEAEDIVRRARPPFPRDGGDEKLIVWGQTSAGRYLQVIYILPDDENLDLDGLDAAGLLGFLDGEQVVYVIHAMDMTQRQKSQYKRL